MWLCFSPSTQPFYQKLNQSNITLLHWFYLLTAKCFNPKKKEKGKKKPESGTPEASHGHHLE
jgi:hypothetical protein